MRRKTGQLVPLEVAICQAAAHLRATGVDAFHGYQLATALADAADVRQLTAYGTLYRALSRLDKMGLLSSAWEDPAAQARENRPRRRMYALTAAGDAALAAIERERVATSRLRPPRLARA